MVVVGLIEVNGLAAVGTAHLIDFIRPFGPSTVLAVLHGITLFATELLFNAAVAVLITPVAGALAESLGVDPRPFLIAVMLAASAEFATPSGYQTNFLVYELGKYSYIDFLRSVSAKRNYRDRGRDHHANLLPILAVVDPSDRQNEAHERHARCTA